MNQKTVILSCSSLKDYVEAAQRAVGTAFPVIYLNRVYHRDPQEMREHVLEELGRLPEDVGTVLVSMGFCGGSWEDVEVPCRVVLPRLNDCRRPDYRAVVQADADWLGASLGYVPGGTHLLEKLFSGRWDGQFLVLEKGTRTNREQILI